MEYIYIREHESYNLHNACKLGKTSNLPDRDSQYVTGEIKRGYFSIAFKVHNADAIEKKLHEEFKEINIRYDAGIEFFKIDIIHKVEPFLQKLGIIYEKLNKEDIDLLIRRENPLSIINDVKEEQLDITDNNEEILKENSKIEPRDDQISIISKSVNYLQNNDKGILVLPCGTGKTLISLWISQQLNCKTILIGVPNILLLTQWKDTVELLFPDFPILLVKNGVKQETVNTFLIIHRKKCIIISSYKSIYKIHNSTETLNFTFSMKICDELHHLTAINKEEKENKKSFLKMLDVKFNKQISLTATLKMIIGNVDEVVSNCDSSIFGDIIEKRCLLSAIKSGVICDYSIQTIAVSDKFKMDYEINGDEYEDNNKRLFISAFTSLESILQKSTHHLIIYSNTTDNAKKIIDYINKLNNEKHFNINNFYYSEYISTTKKDKIDVINNFKNAQYGILSCVYCLGEGWDFPVLDGVVFAENMSSSIRIVQSALRANRKDKNNLNKKAKIILPILYDKIIDSSNPDLKKVKEVIYQMGLEDETIISKIFVSKMDINKEKSTIGNNFLCKLEEDFTLKNDILLKTIDRSRFFITYERAKSIIHPKKLKSKDEYHELCKNDIRLPDEPDEEYGKKFLGWIDYLGIEGDFYTLDECKQKVREYLKMYPDMKKNKNINDINFMLCKLDNKFPPCELWTEYYQIFNIGIIIDIDINKKSKGVCN